MARIFLLIDNEANRRMLAAMLKRDHAVTLCSDDADLDEDYDLGVADGQALARLRAAIAARKRQEEPVLLPFLLVSSRRDLSLASSDLWQVVDDMLTTPIGKMELQARIALLLKVRRLSLELKQRNDDLQMFIRALSHDLRAPARIALGFSEALREDCGQDLNQRGRHYLDRIEASTRRIRDFLDLLLGYARLGRQRVSPQPVALTRALRSAVNHVEDVIDEAGAEVRLAGPFPTVLADPELIDLVLTNLLTNAVKFVEPGKQPRVVVSCKTTDDGTACIEVRDNGLGIPAEALDRIFEPLVRLHGEESYEEAGLGLAVVQRSAALMGGEVGVSSVPGQGSTFRVLLPFVQGGGP